MTPPVAVIDIGTNTIKCLIAHHDSSGWCFDTDTSYPTRIGEHTTQTGIFSEIAIERNLKQLNEIVTDLHNREITRICIVGTMAFRIAKNASHFVQLAREQLGIEIEILSGTEESRLAYFAARHGFVGSDGQIGVFDVGGGSTEIIIGNNSDILSQESYPIGAVQLTETYLAHSDPPTPGTMKAMETEISRVLSKGKRLSNGAGVVGIGGTLVSIAAIAIKMKHFDASVHGFVVDREELEYQWRMFQSQTIAQRKKIPGMDPARADVILAGTSIVRLLLDHWSVEEVKVCLQGLRHGLVRERFPEEV